MFSLSGTELGSSFRPLSKAAFAAAGWLNSDSHTPSRFSRSGRSDAFATRRRRVTAALLKSPDCIWERAREVSASCGSAHQAGPADMKTTNKPARHIPEDLF